MRFEVLARACAVGCVVYALSFPTISVSFVAGSEENPDCRFALEAGDQCDGTGGQQHPCELGADKCKDVTPGSGPYSSCTNGGGNEVDCSHTAFCATPVSGNPHHPVTNTTGCD